MSLSAVAKQLLIHLVLLPRDEARVGIEEYGMPFVPRQGVLGETTVEVASLTIPAINEGPGISRVVQGL
jgi:hypothetical protein